jgi:hypothetical protein
MWADAERWQHSCADKAGDRRYECRAMQMQTVSDSYMDMTNHRKGTFYCFWFTTNPPTHRLSLAPAPAAYMTAQSRVLCLLAAGPARPDPAGYYGEGRKLQHLMKPVGTAGHGIDTSAMACTRMSLDPHSYHLLTSVHLICLTMSCPCRCQA